MSTLVIGEGTLGELGSRMRELGLAGRAFVISDERVYPLYGEAVRQSLQQAGFDSAAYQLPCGEASKSLSTTWVLYDWLVEQRAERRDIVIALGGGVVGDIAGFVAATFLRGMPFIQVPTTILAQIDSAIGGKVGVDHPRGKNLIGAFYPACLILGDTAVLRTLPRREIAAGWAEAIKCAMILDAELLDLLEANADKLCDLTSPLLSPIIERCARHKVEVVAQDERETGLRMILNYGHTIGHALEAALDYQVLLHGEAVSIGMAGAAAISVAVGLLEPAAAERQNQILESFGLPIRLPSIDRPLSVETVLERMSRDKKTRGARNQWILLDRIGHARIESNVPVELVERILRSLLAPSPAADH